MKKAALVMGIILSSAAAKASGTTIGNGGNGIVCKNLSGGIASVELLDFYEARLRGGILNLNSQLRDYKAILNDNLGRWEAVAPQRIAQYKAWLVDFESELLIASGIYIPAIPDTGSIVIPLGCEAKPIAFQRPDSEILPGVKRYTIDKDIWDLMSDIQKAGLVMHELIYREGIKMGHKTSYPTRYFNGYLATAEPKAWTYAAVVSQLPLFWTELSGMILRIPIPSGRSSIIHEDGTIDAYIQNIFGDVVTDNFRIIGGSLKGTSLVSLKFDGLKFSFGHGLNAKSVIVSSPQYHLDFKIGQSVWVEHFEVGMDNVNPLLRIRCSTDCSSMTLNNPPNNWVMTKNADRISNINSMNGLNSGNYAEVITTTTGEIWQWSYRKHDYVKSN